MSTHESDQDEPGCENECCERGRDSSGRRFGVWTECVMDLGSEVERRFIGMLWRRFGAGQGEVEQVEFGWVVLEGAEDEGDAQRCIGCRRERGRWAGHVLKLRVG